MKIKKCLEHGYTLNGICGKCGKETRDAHYKFVKMSDVSEIFKKKN